LIISQLKLEKRTLQRQLDHMRESNRTLTGKIDSTKEENDDLRASLTAIGSQLADDNSQGEEFERVKSEYESSKELFEKTLQERDTALAYALEQKDKLEQEKEDLEKESSSIKSSLEELNSRLGALKDDMLSKEKTVGNLQTEKDELNTELDSVRNKLRQETNKIRQVSEENTAIKQQMLHLTNDIEISDKQSKNRINTLEIEITKGTAAKDTVEKMLRRREQDVKTLKREMDGLREQVTRKEKEMQVESANVNEELINAETRKFDALKIDYDKLLQKIRQLELETKNVSNAHELLTVKNQTLENEISNCRNNFNTMKIENERLTKKIRQLERTATENNDLGIETKRLKGANYALAQRIRVLESDENPTVSKVREEEREKHSSLVVKYNYLSKQLESCKTELNTSEKENKSLKEKLKGISTADVTIQKLNQDLENLRTNKQKTEQDLKYLLKSRREEAETVFSNKRSEIELERDTIKAKYELLRVDCDKMTKEKDHYIMTINTLREENGKLHDQIRKQRLISSSTQDLMMQRLRDENETLQKQYVNLQDSLERSNVEKKELANRVGKTDESVVTNLRSLKARKNELQIRVNTLEREKEQLLKQLNERKEGVDRVDSPLLKTRLAQLEMHESDLQGQLLTANSKATEFELDNGEFRKKLQESEGLIYDLQQALSQANDLAMQKSLEATKTRRLLELKNDKLFQENTELKRKVFFTGKNDGEISPTSLFPRISPHLFTETQDSKARKCSLPASIQDDKCSAAGMNRTKRMSSLKDNNNRSFEYPLLEPMRESKNFAEPPPTRRLSSSNSSQVELDLSQQLRELLDLTNDLTKPNDEDKGGQSSDESLAPPVPPLPVNYETLDRYAS